MTTTHHSFQVPNEYFHTVLINVLWHHGEPTAEMLTKEAWYTGTGFFYRRDGHDYLVTARHILSARSWRENHWRDKELAPTHIRISVRQKLPADGFNADSLGVYDVILPLLDENDVPLWLEHPSRGCHVDVSRVASSRFDQNG